MSCKQQIFRNELGEIEQVLAPNGQVSLLYSQLSKIPGMTTESALRAWAQTYTETFKNWGEGRVKLDENGEPVLRRMGANYHFVKLPSTNEVTLLDTNGRPIIVSADRISVQKITGQYFLTVGSTIIGEINVAENETDVNILGAKLLAPESGSVTPEYLHYFEMAIEAMEEKFGEGGEYPININAGKGVGEMMYRTLGQHLNRMGKSFYSDTRRSPSAEGLWSKLAAKGLAKRENLYSEEELQEFKEYYPDRYETARNKSRYKYLAEEDMDLKDYIIPEGEYYSLNLDDDTYHFAPDMNNEDPEDVQKLGYQINTTTPKVQKETAEQLIIKSNQYENDNRDEKVYKRNGKSYSRVSNLLDRLRKGYYSFSGNKDEFIHHAEWGTIVDKILEDIIQGKNTPIRTTHFNEYSITEEAIQKIYNKVAELYRAYPDHLFLSQITMGNHRLGFAGTADIILVAPDGSIKIVDLKSSNNPITKPYSYMYEGEERKAWYTKPYVDYRKNKRGEKKASKAARHKAQLSLYQALAEANGVTVTDLYILPAHLQISGEKNILDLKFEEMYKHSPDKVIIDNFKSQEDVEAAMKKVDSHSNVQFLEDVSQLIKAEIKSLKKSSDTNKAKKLARLGTLEEMLQLGEETTATAEFIEYAYSYVSNDLSENINNIQELISRGIVGNTNDFIREIHELREEVRVYKQVFDIFTKYIVTHNIAFEDHSPLQHAAITKDILDEQNEILHTMVAPIIAKELASHINPELAVKAQKELEGVNRRIKAIEKRVDPEKLKTHKSYLTLKERAQILEVASDQSEESILQMLQEGGYQDITAFQANFMAAISSNSSIVALFVKSLSDAYAKSRTKMIELQHTAEKILKDYRGTYTRSDEYNKKFLEITKHKNGDYYSFVQKLDYNRWKIDSDALWAKIRAEVEKEAEENESINIDFEISNRYYIKAKELGLRREVDKDDEYIENPYTKEKVLIKQGLDSIIKEKKLRMTDAQYTKWYKRNFIDDVPVGKDVTRPDETGAYRNPRYTAIMSNPQDEKYYKSLIAIYFKSQEQIQDTRMMYKIPQIYKTGFDRVAENGVGNFLSQWKKDITNVRADNTDYNKADKTIPHYYSNVIAPQDTSLDLLGSVLVYAQAAEKFATNYSYEGYANELLTMVKENPPAQSWDGLQKLSNRPFFQKYKDRHGTNNTAALLEAFIDMQIYGQTKFQEKVGRTDIGKIVDSIMSFASFTQIGGNPVLGVANALAAKISTSIDGWASANLKAASWAWSKAEYYKNEAAFMQDMLNPIKKSKISQLAELYDAVQGDFTDEFGRKLTQDKLKKMWGSKAWFAMMKKGEHAAQIRVMLAKMHETKVLINGRESTLYDAYHLVNDRLALKEGVTDLNKKPITNLLDLNLMHTINALNKEFNGVYNKFDQVAIKRHSWGRALMMYRDFVIPGVHRRIGTLRVDQERGDLTEGYYITFFRTLVREFDEMKKFLFGRDNNLTDLEKKNLKKTLVELAYMITLSSLAMLLKMLSSYIDEDENPALYRGVRVALYLNMRAFTELSFYNFGMGNIETAGLPLSVGGTLKTFRTPSPIWSVFTKTINVARYTGALISDNMGLTDSAYYKQDSDYVLPFVGNIAQKGDPKALVAALKLLGFNNYLLSPDNAIKILEMND